MFRILKTGGAYTQETGAPYSEEEATRIEEKYRKGFQKDSESLFIFGIIKEDTRGEDVSGGFGVPDEFLETREISDYFELVAWDDLIFIINPKYNTLYVVAYTDTD